LVGPNLVIYDPINHRYYLGPTVTRLASNAVTSHRFLIMIAKDEMSQLSSLFKESITLDAMIGISFVPLHAIYNVNHMEFIVGETVQESRPVIPLGNDKILLSQLSSKKLLLAMKLVKQQIIDNHIVLDMEDLEKQLEKIRQQGYIISHKEKNPDGYVISVPIKHYSYPASITIFGPETHYKNITPSMIQEFVESGKRISSVLHKTLIENKSQTG
jgi:DNA-binding IclR family transcriptional regulator